MFSWETKGQLPDSRDTWSLPSSGENEILCRNHFDTREH